MLQSIEELQRELKKEDFVSDQMVKWCPGCGNHAILSSITNLFPKIGYKQDDIVVVSGIGCSSRMPYYVNTYGFHGIHGRAATIASGVKIANPELSVWLVSGDGDSLAIGGNHFIHLIRRNIDINYLLFNNQIYGLTKGQFSPTSPYGSVTKTSPYGTIENPFNVGELVMGAQGTFFARVMDSNPRMMSELMQQASAHKGTSVIEIIDNCVIFNDHAQSLIYSKETREDYQLLLHSGERMLFGKNNTKGIVLRDQKLAVVEIGQDGVKEEEVLIHDPQHPNTAMEIMLTQMMPPQYPLALGIIKMVQRPAYNDLMSDSIREAKATSDISCVDDLLNSGEVFEIK